MTIPSVPTADPAPIQLLGTRAHPLTVQQWNEVVARSIEAGRRTVVLSLNLHALYLLGREPRLMAAHRGAEYVRIDGMPVVGLARLLGASVRREHRVTWLDWIHPLLTLAEQRRWSVFYLGSEAAVLARGAARLGERYPRLRLATHHGHFSMDRDGAENGAVIRRINAFEPDILLVGMGMPRQEIWVHENAGRLSATVILTAGACMDYIARAVPTPPRWLGSVGLEWAYRLVTNPRRLAARYLLEPWALAPRIVRAVLRARVRWPPRERAREQV